MSDRVLGLIGGISWESTAHYYRALNEGVRVARGAPHAAELRLHSCDFATISALQHAGRWDELAVLMADAARGLAAAGAGRSGANPRHQLVDAVAAGGGLPGLHSATPTAAAARAAGCRRLLFLGTAFAMEQPFLLDRLRAEGLEVFVPEAADRAEVHRVIFE
ncbi:MAG: aspartate/glutamate racemase family protein, partial [Lysobacteraceae bacterium]